MDVVYPYKLTNSNELEYSIKLLKKNYPDLKKIWLIGDQPPPSVREHVIHVFHQSTLTKWGDSLDKVRCIIREPELTDSFVLFNDDFFVLKEMKPGMYMNKTIPTLKELASKRGGDSYAHAVHDTIDFLEENGLPTFNFGIHLPIVMNKMLLSALLSNIEVGRGLLLRSAYGNSYLSMASGSRYDVKDIPIKDIDDFLSTSNIKFMNYKGYLARRL